MRRKSTRPCGRYTSGSTQSGSAHCGADYHSCQFGSNYEIATELKSP